MEGAGMHLVNWKTLSIPSEEGGLEIGNRQ